MTDDGADNAEKYYPAAAFILEKIMFRRYWQSSTLDQIADHMKGVVDVEIQRNMKKLLAENKRIKEKLRKLSPRKKSVPQKIDNAQGQT